MNERISLNQNRTPSLKYINQGESWNVNNSIKILGLKVVSRIAAVTTALRRDTIKAI